MLNVLTCFEDAVPTAPDAHLHSEDRYPDSHQLSVLFPIWSWEVLTLLVAYHEGGPPPTIPDLVTSSYPRLVARSLMQGATHYLGNLDKYARFVLLLDVSFSAIPKGTTR